MNVEEISSPEAIAIALVLRQRFGDGSVYLRSRDERLTFKRARRLGFVDYEGFITRAGHAFCDYFEPLRVA